MPYLTTKENEMPSAEPQGCLTALLSLFGVMPKPGAAAPGPLPYSLRDDFLSPAEFSFYRVLLTVVRTQLTVCPKVNLADVFFVSQSSERQSYHNRIDRKHVDFLLCDPKSMRPRCGVELDDASHGKTSRQERDRFVDEVFQAAGLPLLRVTAQSAYNPAALLDVLKLRLSGSKAAVPPVPPGPNQSSIMCPKCGVPMVQRVAKKGDRAGLSFYGCPNYPKCRETLQSV